MNKPSLLTASHFELHVMDVHQMPFPEASFDQVFTSCTFCSVPDPVAGLAALRRVLKLSQRASACPGRDLMKTGRPVRQARNPEDQDSNISYRLVSFLEESFNSRFGACSGTAFTPGIILANGAVCGVVGVCTASSFATYQFSIAGTDANGHALTFDSAVLQLGARPAGQSISITDPSVMPRALAPTPRAGQPREIRP